MIKAHSFHIPIMGVGYTIDTPLKVSQFGIDSVLSLGDDILFEKLRKMYCEKSGILYEEISDKIKDFRAKRITSYLNLINKLAEKKFEELKNITKEKSNDLKEYFNSLPERSQLKEEFKNRTSKYFKLDELKSWIHENLTMGSIDVNIMTKCDKENYFNKEKLPVEFNDAHAAVRGFAESDLSSSLVLSAGMNPRLYGYMAEFKDFYPNEKGDIKKKIVLKVSDYRSALIQGKFLAKKGLWVSEYRIESGLNCGGHAFATDGLLLGPILEKFKDNRRELIESVYEILVNALEAKNYPVPDSELPLKITAQGGVGTNEEHDFLIDYFEVDSVGWGTPFLLVPEVTNVDKPTLEKLKVAKEEDIYLSNVSPLGVPFNNLKDNSKDLEKSEFIHKGRPGSSCPKKYLAFNTEFTELPICTASRQYQHLKVNELLKEGLSKEQFQVKFDRVVDKACICVGLGTSALIVNGLNTKVEGPGVSICPGPNLAYFSKISSLKEMVDHIYGRTNIITRKDRPNMFNKELSIYIDYLEDKIAEAKVLFIEKDKKYLTTFVSNLLEGVNYYNELFLSLKDKFNSTKNIILVELATQKKTLKQLSKEIDALAPVPIEVESSEN